MSTFNASRQARVLTAAVALGLRNPQEIITLTKNNDCDAVSVPAQVADAVKEVAGDVKVIVSKKTIANRDFDDARKRNNKKRGKSGTKRSSGVSPEAAQRFRDAFGGAGAFDREAAERAPKTAPGNKTNIPGLGPKKGPTAGKKDGEAAAPAAEKSS